jgi:glycosyltransferase involved in cell wall biosynthesis
MGEMTGPLLSICVNTRNRASLLHETLNSFLNQIEESIEIVVVDGASTDDTEELMVKLTDEHDCITYFRSEKLIGIDEGYDVAVGLATGAYCWMMTDDDLAEAGTIDRLIAEIAEGYDLILVNLECYTKDLQVSLNQRLFQVEADREYSAETFAEFLDVCGVGLSYIGSVVFRKPLWFEFDRTKYYGSYFAHVAVILESSSIDRIRLISHPYIIYRSANSSWTPRSFEIWNFKWPQLVWGSNRLSETEKKSICPREPWTRTLSIVKSRAMGEFDVTVLHRFLRRKLSPMRFGTYYAIAITPKALLNFSLLLFCLVFKRPGHYTIYNFVVSSPYPRMAGLFASLFGITFKKRLTAKAGRYTGDEQYE